MSRKRKVLIWAIVGGTILVIAYDFLKTREDPIAEIADERGIFYPEALAQGEWTFWCMSADPGINYVATHFAAADAYAKANKLKYGGPSNYPSDGYSGWPIIFVAADGKFKVVELHGYELEGFPIDTSCWRAGKAFFKIEPNKALVARIRR